MLLLFRLPFFKQFSPMHLDISNKQNDNYKKPGILLFSLPVTKFRKHLNLNKGLFQVSAK
ncbi:hypothetical protein B1H10_03690 [candidate division KSB1 bacterium 4484_188]|nr:MAG: hypothetical protein B1H10_03690 [candidate division KSB1 bacterium 4484_188]